MHVYNFSILLMFLVTVLFLVAKSCRMSITQRPTRAGDKLQMSCQPPPLREMGGMVETALAADFFSLLPCQLTPATLSCSRYDFACSIAAYLQQQGTS